jgi:hypothetical protein
VSLAPDGTQSSIHPLQQGCVNPEGLLPALGDDGTCRPCGYVCEWLPRPKDRTAAAQRGPSEMFGTNSTVPRVTQDWLVSISFKMPTSLSPFHEQGREAALFMNMCAENCSLSCVHLEPIIRHEKSVLLTKTPCPPGRVLIMNSPPSRMTDISFRLNQTTQSESAS